MNTTKCMSYFPAPITTVRPTESYTCKEVYALVAGDGPLKSFTTRLRALLAEGREKEFKQMKQQCLPFVTPHGLFSYRRTDCMEAPSGLEVIDIDRLASLEAAEELRNRLFADPYLRPRLAFVSPGGRGVKLFVPGTDTVQWAMQYIRLMYADLPAGQVDGCGKDAVRTCFLCHDGGALYRD